MFKTNSIPEIFLTEINMKKIALIGNNNNNSSVTDGGRVKIRLFVNILQREGKLSEVIELSKWYLHIPSLISKIKKAVNRKDVILIMAGPKGCRFTIPLVNKYNKGHKTRVVFCPVGIGTFDKIVKKLSPENVVKFLNGEDNFGITDKKMEKELKKIDLVVPENKTLSDAYKRFYGLDNVELLTNFRDVEPIEKSYSNDGELRIMYGSRICENKGIFDLLEAVSSLNANGHTNISLTIYGDKQLTPKEDERFQKYLSDKIVFKGVLKQNEMIDEIKKHDLFCLPTKYHGEGTPGVFVESFIAGTPVLSSSYSQAYALIEEGVTGYIYKISDVEDLKAKILMILNDKAGLEKVGRAAQEKSKQFCFEYNKEKFFKYFLGDEQ